MAKAQVTEQSKNLRQTDMPAFTVEDTIRIPTALVENFAGKSAVPHDVAFAIGLSPTSSQWKMLSGAAAAYGLVDGGYNASQIVLTELGRALVDGDAVARRSAALTPRVPREIFEHYNRQKFPKPEIAPKILPGFGIPADRVERTYEVLLKIGLYAGILRETANGYFVGLDTVAAFPGAESSQPGDSLADNVVDLVARGGGEAADGAMAQEAPVTTAVALAAIKPKPAMLFVAHGKNMKALDDLKKILNEFKIPYKVAVDEPNKGRPISAKVAELMNDCTAGVFLFTRDELFHKKNPAGDFEEIWRPSENVVYELGAAMVLWERKIIIVREDGVNFPSDYRDLGYITFNSGELSSKTVDILKELIAFNLLKLSAA